MIAEDLKKASIKYGSILKVPESEILRIGRAWKVPEPWIHYSRHARSYYPGIPWFYRFGGFAPILDSFGVLIYADDTFRGKLKSSLFLFDRLLNAGGMRCRIARFIARKVHYLWEIQVVIDIYKYYASMFGVRDGNRWYVKVWDRIFQTYLRKGKT